MIEEKIEGVNLKDRRRSFNNLVFHFNVEDFTPIYIDSLFTSNHTDLLFLAALANKFGNGEIICKLLKSEDEIVVSTALKSRWLFKGQTDTHLINPAYFSTHIFPFITYSTRCKIINKLSVNLKNQTLAESFYKCISEKYGRDHAVKLLPICSENFITNEFEIEGFVIPELQIKYIYRQYPRLIVNILKKYNNSHNAYNFYVLSEILRFIVHDYPEDFIEMFNRKSFNFSKIGYKTTLSLLKCDKKFVIDNASNLFRSLDYEALFKTLKGDERDQFFMNIFPTKKKDFNYYDIKKIFEFLKPEYRTNYLMTLYSKVYNNESYIQSNDYPEDLIQFCQLDLRSEWAKRKISEVQEMEEEYLKYMPIDYALKRLMELNNSASKVDKRSVILKSMIDCCKINKNSEKMLDVLKYVAKRHRNDAENLRYGFLDHLKSQFELHKLSSDHWEVINEMIKIMIYNEDITKYYRQRFLASILEEFIHFRLMNNMEIDSIIDILIEQKCNRLNLLRDHPEYEKIVFAAVLKRFQIIIENKPFDKKLTEKIYEIFDAYEDMKNKIPLNDIPWLVNALKLCTTSEDDSDYSVDHIVYTMRRYPETRKMFSDILIKRCMDEITLRNALNHNAKIIYDNIEIIIKNHVDYSAFKYLSIYRLIKYMNQPLATFIINNLKNKLQNPEDPDLLPNIIIILSYLIDVEETEKIVAEYVPAMTKIEISEDPNVRAVYKRTETLVKNFKDIMPPLSFNLVFKFSQNDYFKFGLPTILHMCFKKTENATLPFIKELSKQPVSIKKHSIRLAYFLFSKHECLNMYAEMWKGEKNSSIRDALFQRTFKIFQKETDMTLVNSAFEILKKFLCDFREIDKNLFLHLNDLSKVKTIHKSEYCRIAWSTLKILDKNKVNVSIHQDVLIRSAIQHMDILDEDFCTSIIEEYLQILGNSKIPYLSALSEFCMNYLLGAKSEELQGKHISKFCPIFQTFMRQKWDDVEYRHGINDFLETFCMKTISFDFKVNPNSLLKNLYEIITSSVPFEAVPKLYLIYSITISLVQSLQCPLEIDSKKITPCVIEFLEKFSQKICNRFEEFIKTCGTEIMDIFSSSLKQVLEEYSQRNNHFMIHFIQMLLRCEYKRNRCYLLLLIDLMPTPFGKDELLGFEMQNTLLKEISAFKDSAVKTKLGLKFDMPLAYFVNQNE